MQSLPTKTLPKAQVQRLGFGFFQSGSGKEVSLLFDAEVTPCLSLFNTIDWKRYKQEKLLSHSPAGQKSRIQMSAPHSPPEASPLEAQLRAHLWLQALLGLWPPPCHLSSGSLCVLISLSFLSLIFFLF